MGIMYCLHNLGLLGTETPSESYKSEILNLGFMNRSVNQVPKFLCVHFIVGRDP